MCGCCSFFGSVPIGKKHFFLFLYRFHSLWLLCFSIEFTSDVLFPTRTKILKSKKEMYRSSPKKRLAVIPKETTVLRKDGRKNEGSSTYKKLEV